MAAERSVGETELAELIWQHTGRQRAAAHRRSGQAGCWTRRAPYGAADPRAAKVRAECRQVGCLDLVHEIYTVVGRRLAAVEGRDQIRDGARFANVVVAREVTELDRRIRVAHGLPARPTRSDGSAGRVVAEIAATADEAAAERLVELFESMRAYALDPAAGRWPVGTWQAQRRAAGVSADLAADIALVTAAAERAAGSTWVRRHLNPSRSITHVTGVDELAQLTSSDEEDLLWSVFRGRYLDARAHGLPVEQSLRQSADQVFGYRIPKLNPRLRDLVAEIEPSTRTRRAP